MAKKQKQQQQQEQQHKIKVNCYIKTFLLIIKVFKPRNRQQKMRKKNRKLQFYKHFSQENGKTNFKLPKKK